MHSLGVQIVHICRMLLELCMKEKRKKKKKEEEEEEEEEEKEEENQNFHVQFP